MGHHLRKEFFQYVGGLARWFNPQWLNHCLMVVVILGWLLPVGAESREKDKPEAPQILRDAETEFYLRRFATPIFTAAGINPDVVQLALINDNRLNAFVANGQNMFFHTGLLLAAEDPSELIGVIAHETGHIAGGHLIRGRAAMEDASTQAILATVLGVAAAVGSGRGDAGFAVIAGGQQLATRNLFAFSRAQESSADLAGLRFLEAAHLSPAGFLRFMERLGDQELMPTSRQSEYVRTHPLTRDRIDTIAVHTEQSPWRDTPLPSPMLADFRRMRAKLNGYLFPRNVLQRYDAKDQSVEARYGRAIALWRSSDYAQALTVLDGLIADYPQDPFFYEQRGQIEVETGALAKGAESYRHAFELAPDQPLIALGYAQAMLQTGTATQPEKIVPVLQKALEKDRRLALAHRLLAHAYSQMGREADARLSSAEAAFLERDLPAARHHITVALQGLKKDSPAWVNAHDLEAQIDRAEEERDK